VKAPGSTREVHLKLVILSAVEEGGIPSVVVKYVDIWRNIGGEGDLLDCY
jgi:hypothetical protein